MDIDAKLELTVQENTNLLGSPKTLHLTSKYGGDMEFSQTSQNDCTFIAVIAIGTFYLHIQTDQALDYKNLSTVRNRFSVIREVVYCARKTTQKLVYSTQSSF